MYSFLWQKRDFYRLLFAFFFTNERFLFKRLSFIKIDDDSIRFASENLAGSKLKIILEIISLLDY